MGLIGWADAPNTEENKEAFPGDVTQVPTAPAINQELLSEAETAERSVSVAEVPIDSNDALDFNYEVSVSRTSVSVSDWGFDSVSEEDKGKAAAIELFNAIRGLRLNQHNDETGMRNDISKFELHEVKFLFDHAERCGFEDYFTVVKEVFAVKHRILDEGNDIDAVESPNLDDLLEFVEAKYEKAYGGDGQ